VFGYKYQVLSRRGTWHPHPAQTWHDSQWPCSCLSGIRRIDLIYVGWWLIHSSILFSLPVLYRNSRRNTSSLDQASWVSTTRAVCKKIFSHNLF
jgi:hypothetical protein